MSLKRQLLLLMVLLHCVLFGISLVFINELGLYLIAVEAFIIVSLILFSLLIKKAMLPLEYVETFSKLLNEEDYTARFSAQKQNEINSLIQHFNTMLGKLYQERLAIGEQKGIFQKLIDESPIGLILLDYDHRISDINPASEHLLSISKNEVIGKPLKQLSQSGHSQLKYLLCVDIDKQELVDAEQGRQLKVAHFEIIDRGFKRSFYMVHELTGEIIASQKAAYEKLIRLMSHEVNNTIAITNSLLESCLSFKPQLDKESSAEFENAINIVVNRSESLNRFMQGYANVVKLDKPIKTAFDLSKMLRDLSTLFYAECKKRNISIVIDLIPNITVIADASLIEQALVNIIKNALEASISDGEIVIGLKRSEGDIVLSIADSGCGIPPHIERQLFTPFFTSKEFGQGVGLMLVREILKMHDISYTLSNRANKQGAVFTWWMKA